MASGCSRATYPARATPPWWGRKTWSLRKISWRSETNLRRASGMYMETKLSCTAFWDAVEQRLTACSAEELRAIVRALARATPPAQRQAFLDTLQPMAATAAVGQPEPPA